jgi:hypothetical protein
VLRIILAIGAASVLWWSSATAQESRAAQQRVVTRICTSDLSARCGVVRGDRSQIRTCVKEHLKDLSAPCQASLARLAAINKACAADVKQTCASVKPGHGRVEACLQSALADLSDACKDALAQVAAGGP